MFFMKVSFWSAEPDICENSCGRMKLFPVSEGSLSMYPFRIERCSSISSSMPSANFTHLGHVIDSLNSRTFRRQVP